MPLRQVTPWRGNTKKLRFNHRLLHLAGTCHDRFREKSSAIKNQTEMEKLSAEAICFSCLVGRNYSCPNFSWHKDQKQSYQITKWVSITMGANDYPTRGRHKHGKLYFALAKRTTFLVLDFLKSTISREIVCLWPSNLWNSATFGHKSTWMA